MTIYAFNIFDRHCHCIYNREFTQLSQPSSSQQNPSSSSISIPSSSTSNKSGINKNNYGDNSKLLFGIIYSLNQISSKLVSSSENPSESTNELKTFTIGQFKIHFWESLTKFKFILTTDINVTNLSNELWYIYSTLFLKYVVDNPLSPIEFKVIEHDEEDTKSTKNLSVEEMKENEAYGMIQNWKFIEETDIYLKSLPIFV
ncbi:uncharacterized protein KGF55_000771 [Candida pseudojiufengensis]|uniref:uncharacterized protein n=1 Tax=Candida pseudojiufengensis TaxID=497109 RepID=UPI002224BAE1|nr:uncharacterized protein KGF55_000771 [Candida pseudojiufengensis]KAI5966462.1 hypothetical protein KGF55_000771 [Candida pseudojiufengensis]